MTIQNVTQEDAGEYICQINTEPMKNYVSQIRSNSRNGFFNNTVVLSMTQIQICRQNWNDFLSNISHQTMIQLTTIVSNVLTLKVVQTQNIHNYWLTKFWSALKVPPNDFIQKMSQAPSKCLKKWIKVDRLDFSKTHSIWKILSVLGADKYLEILQGKIRKN